MIGCQSSIEFQVFQATVLQFPVRAFGVLALRVPRG